MPTFNADQLPAIASKILLGAGVSAEDAPVIASELKDANLVGHDSHGVIRLMQYVRQIDEGHIKPGGEFEVLHETGSLTIIDGHFDLGQVTANKAINPMRL